MLILLPSLAVEFAGLNVVSVSQRADDMDGLFRDGVLSSDRESGNKSLEILLVGFQPRLFARWAQHQRQTAVCPGA